MTILIGFESANSYVKATSNISTGVEKYLNTLVEENESSALSDGIDKKIKNGFYKYDGKYYRAGQTKKTSNVVSSSSKTDNRYSLPEYKRESLIAIYKQLEKAGHDVFNEDIYVVTGLPLNQCDEMNIEQVKNALEGQHVINNKAFTIKEVKVIKQGLASYYDKLLDNDGNVNPQFAMDINGQDLLVVDIGHGTTDSIVIKDLSPGDFSVSDGMGSAYSKILSQSLNQKFKTNKHIDSLSVATSLEKGSKSTGYQLKVGNIVDNDISETAIKEFKELASRIIKEITSKFDFTVLEKVMFCGGGSIGLKPYLLEAIWDQHKEEDNERIIWFDNAQTSNAQGYFKYGKNYFKNHGVDL